MFIPLKEKQTTQSNIRRERNIMMKKNGFTLAEVLITLAIIGVVATMTLPALMTNTAEQQAKTALKKGINTLTEAAQMNQSIEGFDYASLTETSTDNPDTQSLYGLLAKRTSVDYTKSGTGTLESHQGAATNANGSNYTIFFRDGSAVSFDPATVSTTSNGTEMQSDGLVYGIRVLFDTNGQKGPNILSNCTGTALGVTTDSTTADHNTQCSSKNRVIKDQFGLRLRGGYVVPNGAAARWTFEN